MAKCKHCGKRIKSKKTGYCLDCYKSVYLVEHRVVDRNNPESWKRPCPSCGKEIHHETWSSYYAGQRYGHSCWECGNRIMTEKIRLQFPPKVCKCGEVLNRKNTSGMCSTCYAEYRRLLPKKVYEHFCPDCGGKMVYAHKSTFREAKKNNTCCEDCRAKPLLSTFTCVWCKQPFTIDRRLDNPRKTCSDECSRKYKSQLRSYTQNEFIQKAKEVHGETWYDYSKTVYTGCKDKIIITCTRHGDFKQMAQDHLTGSGCPKCNSSHGERLIRIYLEAKKIGYEYQKTFPDCVNPKTGGRLTYDFYVPDYNLLIEYDGIQHYQFMPQDKWRWCKVNSVEALDAIQERDKIKDQYAKDKGMEIIRINFLQRSQIDKVLEKELASLPCRSKSHALYPQICQSTDTF